MNKVKILAVACLTSMAFAGGNLWDFTDQVATTSDPWWGQVHTPGVLKCWSEIDSNKDNNWGEPCYKGAGGYWFGYNDQTGEVRDNVSDIALYAPKGSCPVDGPTPEQAKGSIQTVMYIEPGKQNDSWKDLVVGGPVTEAGHYLTKNYGFGNATTSFDVKFINPAGTEDEPTVAGIGFNWRNKKECGNEDYENVYTEDISGKTGLCIVYKADKEGVEVELGWNEVGYFYNTWVAKLPAATDWKTVEMKWEDFAPSYEDCVDFHPQTIALKNAESLKFAVKNRTATASTIHFELKEVGWAGSCSGTAGKPIAPPTEKWWESCEGNTPINPSKIASAFKFNFNGRMLSVNFAGSVQVISLQGAVVAKKTLAANESMNLSNLPAGIYMVRSEKYGIVQKIMVK